MQLPHSINRRNAPGVFEITMLKSLLTINHIRTSRLIVPIYASDTPIYPLKLLVLAVGLLGGLLFGLLLALVHQTIAILKMRWAGASND